MSTDTRPAILGHEGQVLEPADHRPHDEDATRFARGQQQLADFLQQEFRNAHPIHGACPRDQIEQAVQRATSDKDNPPDFATPEGRSAFYDRVRDQMEAPRDDMLGELSEWQTQHGFY